MQSFFANAIPPQGTLGRPVPEPPDLTRGPFQRDRDRIIHTQAFRRLQGKTQVFVAGEGDHFRTRLTHTMEVAQLSRDVARTLRLNEDLAESIALAHDLGHPPFGHMGEAALDVWMRARGSSFEHNEQSLRVVTLLEEHSTTAPGLNLNIEVLEGLQKYMTKSERGKRGPSLEAQIVDSADRIAYTGHDAEDGIRAGLFTVQELMQTELGVAAAELAKARGTPIRGALIHLLVTDLYRATEEALKKSGVQSAEDVYAHDELLVIFTRGMGRHLDELQQFLSTHMYFHPRVLEGSREGQEIVTRLCDQLFASPGDKVKGLMTKTGSTLAEAVKDYVAGMTDSYARSKVEK